MKHRRFSDYQKFSSLRADAKRFLKRDRNAHFSKIADDVNRNPAAFSKYMKPRFRQAYFDVSLTVDDTLVTDPSELCNVFGSYFESTVNQVPSTDDSPFTSSQSNDACPIDIVCVSEPDVISAGKRLRPLKSVGPDIIPPFLVKGCILVLAPLLIHIFNLSLSSGIFPSPWKDAVVFPVFKSGSRLNVTNYRPISNLCSSAKLFEYVVSASLVPWMRKFVSDDQFGFLSGRSLELNLVSLLHKVAPCLNGQSQFDVAYLDFVKAFVKVKHALLLKKLRFYGMSHSFVTWFSSYLKDRKFIVRCNGVSGDVKYGVLSGVPQGSVLGPILFVIFINDMLSELSRICKWLFADDTKVGQEVRSVSDCLSLQTVLDAVCEWCHRNGMRINAAKSAVVSFSRKATWLYFTYILNGEPLPRCEVQRDLGVLFDTKLIFRSHVLRIIVDCNRYLGILYRMSYCFDLWLPLKSLYVALVLSRISFGSVLWAGCAKYLRVKIEGVQRRFAFMLHRHFFRSVPYDYEAILRVIGLLSISDFLVLRDCLFLYNIVNGVTVAPQLLAHINFRVVSRTWLTDLFYVTDSFQIMSRLCAQFNIFNPQLDMFLLIRA